MSPAARSRVSRGRCIVRSVSTLALALAASTLSIAQQSGTITGRVVTPDGEPATDAVVTVVGTPARTDVRADGTFTIEGVAAGDQVLQAYSPRHGRGVGRAIVEPGGTATVEILLESRMHAEHVVVTASPHSRGELDVASPVTVLDSEELTLQLEPTLGETLDQEAGIQSTWFAPGASRPVIRGLGGDRVKMMENGLDTLDASTTSPDHAVAVDPLAAERIEVVRGPATLLYGSNAIGGVVNVLDRRIPDHRPTDDLFGAVDLRGGTVADERAAAVDLNGGGSQWAWHLDYLTRATDDYDIPGRASLEEPEPGEEAPFGILPNSDLSTDAAGLGVSYFFGERGYFGISVRGHDAEYGIPGGHAHEQEVRGEEHEDEGVRIDLEQRRYDLEGALTRPFGAFRGAKMRFGLVDYEHDELEAPGVVGTSFFNDAWEGRVELIQKDRGSLHGSFGLQLRHRDLEAIGEEAFLPPTGTENAGVFTFQEIGSGALRYQAGLRYEIQDTTVDQPDLPDRDFDGISGSLGIVWQPAGSYALGASLARSVKFPTGEELYSEGLHVATSSFELGDPTLEEEAAVGLDVSLRKVEGRVTGAFSVYTNDFSDYIFQRLTGEEIEGFPVAQWSQADADFLGAELDVSVALVHRAHSAWDLDLLWDVVRAELDSGENLPRIPPQRYGIGLHYRGDRLRGGVDVRHVDEQGRLAPNETPTDGYTMLNADLAYRFFFSGTFLDVILRGTNLTDEEARNHVSFVKDDVPLPGRNVSLIARYRF